MPRPVTRYDLIAAALLLSLAVAIPATALGLTIAALLLGRAAAYRDQ